MNDSKCTPTKHCEKCATVDHFGTQFADAFWATCEWNGECYEWMGTRTHRGYGVIGFQGRQWKAHRIAKALSGEFLPHWLVIDHQCRNTSCVNPAHLRICTNAENVMAGRSFSARNARKTRCPKGHPYTKYGRTTKRKGGRIWRECRRCINDRYAQSKTKAI